MTFEIESVDMYVRLIVFFIIMGGLFWFFRPKPQAQKKEQPAPYTIPKNIKPTQEITKPEETAPSQAVPETPAPVTTETPIEVPTGPTAAPVTQQGNEVVNPDIPKAPEWAKVPEQTFQKPVVLEDKLDDLHDYAPLLKNRLMVKYSQEQFDYLVKESDQYLRNEAEYERANPAKAKEVKEFIDDLYQAKQAAEKERKI